MSDSKLLVSTRQAAAILQVHESSVKRWCNAGALACTYTAGGHRRIPLEAMLAFARAEELASPLLAFAPFEVRLWQAVDQVGKQGFAPVVDLVYTWLLTGQAALVAELIPFLRAWGFPLTQVLDEVLGAVLQRMGEAWAAGEISTGDEHRMSELINDALHAVRLSVQQATEDAAAPASSRATALVGCASGEQHELGALMIRLVLEEAGWRVVYLGTDVPAEDLAIQQAQHQARLMCVSLMPPRGEADARHLVRLLSRLYDAAHPYRLVMGGSVLADQDAMDWSGTPFEEVRTFRSITAFMDWLEQVYAVDATMRNGAH